MNCVIVRLHNREGVKKYIFVVCLTKEPGGIPYGSFLLCWNPEVAREFLYRIVVCWIFV